MQKNPVLIILGGLAGVVTLGLAMLMAFGVAITAAQAAAIVAFVAGTCTLVGTAIRASVYSPATHEAEVLRALATPVPESPAPATKSVFDLFEV